MVATHFGKRLILSFEYIPPYARPGWWTVKRWAEFMWFRIFGGSLR